MIQKAMYLFSYHPKIIARLKNAHPLMSCSYLMAQNSVSIMNHIQFLILSYTLQCFMHERKQAITSDDSVG